MAARLVAAASRHLKATPSTSAQRPLSVRLGSPPVQSSSSSHTGRSSIRRPFSTEEQHEIDKIKNEIAELKVAVQCSGEKQKTFEATTRYEINHSELANLKTTLTLIGLLCGYASVMMCLYQLTPPSEAETYGSEIVPV